MEAKELKEYIAEDSSRIVNILEAVGMHDIWFSKQDEIRCALPDMINKTAVLIKIDQNLYSAAYEIGYGGDLIGLLEEVKGTDFKTTVNFIHSVLGLSNKRGEKKLDPLKLLRRFVTGKSLHDPSPNRLYDESVLNKFIMLPHKNILEEGISPEVTEQFKICYDPEQSRIIFPHFDWEKSNKVVGIKGRTTLSDEEIELIGVPKYWNYINGYQKTENLYGWNLAKENVDKTRVLILFEGEKSVLKQSTMNGNKSNSVALGGHTLSEDQVSFILKNTPIDCEIVIAFDKDVMAQKDYLKEQAERFLPYRKAGYIYDKFGILGEKDSPIDKGYKIWNYLLKYRIPVTNK